MDYTATFASYVPIVNGLINGDLHSKAESWDFVVKWIFAMNSDSKMFSIESLARTFNYANKPTHFCIGYNILEIYVGHKDNRNRFLREYKLLENVDYIEDNKEIRFTFHAFKRLMFMNADINQIIEFEFVDKVYQMYVRYLKKMIARSKINTHWTIIEKVRNLPVNVRNICIEKRGFAQMDAEPRMFYIMKGSSKLIRQKLLNDLKKPADQRQFDTSPIVPIYESLLSNADDEVEMFQRYLIDSHITPFRKAQLNEKIKNINKTKTHIKVLKRAILIDPSQEVYTPEMLSIHINELRLRIKKGYYIQPYDMDTQGNSTSLDIFKRTNGQFFDEFNMIELKPSFDDISLIHTESADEYMPSTNKVQFSEAEEDDEEKTDAELNPKKRQPRMRTMTTDTLTSIEDDEEETKDDDDEEETPPAQETKKRTAAKRCRAKSVAFADQVSDQKKSSDKRNRSKSASHASSDEEGYSSSEY